MSEAADGPDAAKAASLRYVTDSRPGLTRAGAAGAFHYLDAKGERVTDDATLERIAKLVIPPAWTNVWICPVAHGHIQATGRDARGRKQYRYHARWRKVRDETKYERLAEFGAALPKIRARVEEDLALPGLPRNKILAAIVRLLETTLIRVGNEEYARDNKSYGLTTLRTNHVDVDGTTIHFHFRGKSGKSHAIDFRDRRVARLVKRCQELPGHELFQYLDDAGDPHPIDSSDVNAYLHEITAHEFTAKDFRTWGGTLLAARGLRATSTIAATATAAHAATVAVVKEVAKELGNTPAVCRKCYIHPAVLAAYESQESLGRWLGSLGHRAESGDYAADEAALIRFLEHEARHKNREAA